jgi:hypothetical protein
MSRQGVSTHLGVSLKLFVFHFNVGNGRLQSAAPVHQTILAVNQPIIVKSHKCLNDSLAQFLKTG